MKSYKEFINESALNLKDIFKYFLDESDFSELYKKYKDPNRFYHTDEHVLDMISNYLKIFNGKLEDNKDPMFLAIFFHDIFYDVKSKTNEEDSANIAIKFLKKNGYSETFIKEVEELIISTKHIVPPKTEKEKIICDLDLYNLAVSYDEFEKVTNLIRKEYKIYSDEEFIKGRIEFFKKMLNKKIFHTNKFSKYEKIAKQNMQKYIKKNEVL